MGDNKSAAANEYEAEVIPGLEACAIDELRQLAPAALGNLRRSRAGFLRFRCAGGESAWLCLRSVIAVYRIHNFAIPRPKALLGHEHFTRLLGILRAAAQCFGAPPLTMGIAAAGSHTAVMQRLRQEFSRALDLQLAEDGKGELFLRLARQTDGAGWEALVRSTASPLSKRDYRLVDVPGALNATVAYAMTRLGAREESRESRERQTALNLCSGSSTILIEHAQSFPDDTLIAIDNCRDMISIGRQHARQARQSHRIIQLLADARRAPIAAGSVDLLYADLPFGHHIGSHEDNVKLYPALLREASRLAKPDAALILLTHDIRLLAGCIRASAWRIHSQTTISLSGLHPRLFVLRRNSARI